MYHHPLRLNGPSNQINEDYHFLNLAKISDADIALLAVDLPAKNSIPDIDAPLVSANLLSKELGFHLS